MIDENWAGIYGSRNLGDKAGAKEVLVVGSGGIEKNIGAGMPILWGKSG